jgi:hypothetical protein
MKLARAEAPRVLAWVDVVDDLSGLEVTDEDWLPRNELPDTLRALFIEGRTYAPFMVANAAALDRGAEEMEFQLDGVRYWQRPFPYQKKCLTWLREEYAKSRPTTELSSTALSQTRAARCSFRAARRHGVRHVQNTV